MSKRKDEGPIKKEIIELARRASDSESDAEVSPEEECSPLKAKKYKPETPPMSPEAFPWSMDELLAFEERDEEEYKNRIEETHAELLKQARICDKEINDSWDKAHPKGPKHDDCLKNSGSGKTIYNEWTKKLEPELVRVRLGIIKEDCVNKKVPDTDYRKKQAIYDPGNTYPSPGSYALKGAAIPDYIVYRNGSPEIRNIIAVFDLKFPCPSEQNNPGEWKQGQREKYRERFPVEPVLVYPAKRM
jgi:hypothetical protein